MNRHKISDATGRRRVNNTRAGTISRRAVKHIPILGGNHAAEGEIELGHIGIYMLCTLGRVDSSRADSVAPVPSLRYTIAMSKYSLGLFAMAIAAGAAFGSFGTALAATPTQPRVVAKLQPRCAQLATLAERVRCRLQLSVEDLKLDMPEECREITSELLQQSCIAKYESFQLCWAKPVGDERVICGQQLLGLTRTTDELVRQCRGQRVCQLAVQEKVYDLIKFQFSDLEERAAELLADGVVGLNSTVTTVAAIEEQRAAFNEASSNRERQQIIFAVRRIWQEFVAAAKRAER